MRKRQNYKRWVIALLVSLAALLVAVAAVNWSIDPLWCFGHKRWFTHLQKPFNERHQKTNYLTFVNKHQYDAVLVGNSRASLINQNEFGGMRAYNYSLPGMSSYEFRDYLDYFRKTNGEPKTILMAIDFDHANANLKFATQEPDYYIKAARSWLYRYRTLFTYDTLEYSKENLTIDRFVRHNKFGGGAIIYDNNNVARLLKPRDEARRQEYITREVGRLKETYRTGYKYRKDLADAMRQIKQDHPGTRFVAFSTPVSKLYFCAMVQEGKFPDYERWLREMVGVYGEFWNFQYLNSITANSNNYSDSHHYYAEVGTLVAHKISGVQDPNVPADFGVLVTPANIDQHLAKIQADSSSLCK